MPRAIPRPKAATKSAGHAGQVRFLRTVVAHAQDLASLKGLSDTQLRRAVADSFGSFEPTARVLDALLGALVRVAQHTAPKHQNSIAIIKEKRPVVARAPSSAQLMRTAVGQARTAREALVQSKAVLPSSGITTALSISRQALSKAVHANRLFVLELGGERYYPAFFADPLLERSKVERVARTLGDLSGWEKWQFFTTPKGSLGRLTPLGALKKGKYQEVLKAAAGFAER